VNFGKEVWRDYRGDGFSSGQLGMIQDRIGAIQIWEQAFQILDLGQIVYRDVGIGRISGEEVLVVAFRRIETFAGLYRGHQWGVEDPRRV
jgi:hypothetical protein